MKNIGGVLFIITVYLVLLIPSGHAAVWKECKADDSTVFKQTIEGKTCCYDTSNVLRWVDDKTTECKKPTATINSPPSSSWHNAPSFDALAAYYADNSLKYCYYQTWSNGVQVFPTTLQQWYVIQCSGTGISHSETISVTVGSTSYCKDEGENKCEVRVLAVDELLNTGPNPYGFRTFSIDITPPIAGPYSLDGPGTYTTGNKVFTSGSLTHTWSGFSDPGASSTPPTGSGVNSFEIWRASYTSTCNEAGTSGCNWGSTPYHPDTTNPTAGSWTTDAVSNNFVYGWHSSDKAGNYRTETTPIVVIYDNVPPTATITTPVQNDKYGKTTFPATFNGKAKDNTDGAGLNANSVTFYIRKNDNTYWTGSTWSTAVTWLSATNSETTGATEVTWSVSVSSTTWSDGTYYVKVKSVDKAGNPGESAETSFVYDKTPPTTSITLSGTLGNNNWYKSNVQVTLSCSDITSGCSTTKYCIDTTNTYTCTPTTTYSTNLLLTTEGTNYIRYNSTDNANNPETVKSQEIKIDKTPPDTRIDSGPSGTVASTGATLTFSCVGESCAAFECSLDGGNFVSCNSGSISYPGLTDGSHTFQVRGTDIAGNTDPTPASRPWTVDTTPPLRTNGQPSGMITTSSPIISLTTSDISQPVDCRYNTSTAQTTYNSMAGIFTASSNTHSVQLSGLSTSTHTYNAMCKDAVDNKNTNYFIISFNVCSRSNPTVAITPKEQSGEPGDTKAYTVQVANNDQNCGTETFSLTTIGCPTGWTCTLPSSLSIVSGSSSSTTLSITSSSSATEGVNVVNVEAKNAAADLYKSTASATYKLICVYRLAIKQTTNFDTSTKQGRYDGIKYTWALSFADSSSSSCPTTGGKIKYTIPSLQLSGSCDSRETGVYISGSNPPTGVKLSTPYDFSVSRSGSLDNAFKVYLKKSGLNSCTLSFPIKVGGLEVDPSFIVSPGASRQSPHVSLFDFSGDKNSLNVKWDAFYPDDEPFRDMKVKCSVFNPTDNKCDPELEDCSIITGKGCLPYDASQGSQDVKKGSCDVSSPALDLTKDNKIICLFYDPSNTNLKTRVEPSFKPIDFAAQMADKITTTVGKKFDLKIDISNNGTLTDSYKIELSGSGTVDISPVTITTPTIDRNQIVSTFSSITPLVDQSGVVTVKITSLASGKVVTKEIEVAPGLFALPEFGLIGFLQIVAIAAVIYFLLFSRITPKKKKRR